MHRPIISIGPKRRSIGCAIAVSSAILGIANPHHLIRIPEQICIVPYFNVPDFSFLTYSFHIIHACDFRDAKIIPDPVKFSFLFVVPSDRRVIVAERKVLTGCAEDDVTQESCTAHRFSFGSCHMEEVRIRIRSLHISRIIIIRSTEFINLLHDLNRLEKILQICCIVLIADHNDLSVPLLRKAGVITAVPFCKILFGGSYQYLSGISEILDLILCKIVFFQHPVNQSKRSLFIPLCC